eukprot:m.1048 g.1048  ORF g.1048 m.1048 type:complete len:128 (+) comp1003_c0_seq1:392-775(+)
MKFEDINSKLERSPIKDERTNKDSLFGNIFFNPIPFFAVHSMEERLEEDGIYGRRWFCCCNLACKLHNNFESRKKVQEQHLQDHLVLLSPEKENKANGITGSQVDDRLLWNEFLLKMLIVPPWLLYF